jgi:hypothetical protein
MCIEAAYEPLFVYQVLQGEQLMCGGQPWPETSLSRST